MDWKTRHSVAKSMDCLLARGFDRETANHVVDNLKHLSHDPFYYLLSSREEKESIKGLTDLGEFRIEEERDTQKRVKEKGSQAERIGQYKVRVRPGRITFWYYAKTSIFTSTDLHKLVTTDKYAILYDEENGVTDFCRYVYSEPVKIYSFLCSLIFALIAIFSFGVLTKRMSCISFYKVEQAIKSLIDEERIYPLEAERYVDIS